MTAAKLDSSSSNGHLTLLTPATSQLFLQVVVATHYFFFFAVLAASFFSKSAHMLFIAELLQKVSRVLSPFYKKEIQVPFVQSCLCVETS